MGFGMVDNKLIQAQDINGTHYITAYDTLSRWNEHRIKENDLKENHENNIYYFEKAQRAQSL